MTLFKEVFIPQKWESFPQHTHDRVYAVKCMLASRYPQIPTAVSTLMWSVVVPCSLRLISFLSWRTFRNILSFASHCLKSPQIFMQSLALQYSQPLHSSFCSLRSTSAAQYLLLFRNISTTSVLQMFIWQISI